MELNFVFLRSWRIFNFVLLEVYLFLFYLEHTRQLGRHFCSNRFRIKKKVTLNEPTPNWLNRPVFFISTRYVSFYVLFKGMMNGRRSIFDCKLSLVNKSLKTQALIERPGFPGLYFHFHDLEKLIYLVFIEVFLFHLYFMTCWIVEVAD